MNYFTKMETIYQYSNEYDKTEILNKLNNISEQIQEEENKDNSEYNKEKVRKLLYEQFIQGLKLSIK